MQTIGILFIFIVSLFYYRLFHPVLASKSILDKVPTVNDLNLKLELVFRQEIAPSTIPNLTEKTGMVICSTPDRCEPGYDPLGNRLYRYELKDNKLLYSKLLLDLLATPRPTHYGGAIRLGPDNNSYVPIGDVHDQESGQVTNAQNFKYGTDPDGRSGILVVTQDGEPANGLKAILGDKFPLNLYYAYGIRNSFGIDFDPVTGNLWDTEDGPGFGDEINLVEQGFNSGWMKVQSDWKLISSRC